MNTSKDERSQIWKKDFARAAECLWGIPMNYTDYCSYCYADGAFTSECTMDEMIEGCIPPMLESNPELKEEDARSMMQQWFPILKRWKNN